MINGWSPWEPKSCWEDRMRMTNEEKLIQVMLERQERREVEITFEQVYGPGEGKRLVAEVADRGKRAKERAMRYVFEQALELGRAVEIRYYSSKKQHSRREVTPICMMLRERPGVLTWCHTKEATRWFRFDRMGSARLASLARVLRPRDVAIAVASADQNTRNAILKGA